VAKLNSTEGIIFERDVAISMDDGVVLRCDVFRPDVEDQVPVIMTLGPYGKGVRYQDGYKAEWEWLIDKHPELGDNSTLSYMVWETVDPEVWVRDGYAVIRVDARGVGRSQGILDNFSPRESKDYYDSIEWAASQPWCNGRVGLCGVSYYAMSQWKAAALQPPHLAAMIPWDGANEHYREISHHGGILCTFWQMLFNLRITRIQHGKGTNGLMDPWLGEPAAGPETLSEIELEANREDVAGKMKAHLLDDQFHRDYSADLSRITVPLLSAANWGGWGLHPRGNFEGFLRSGSKKKWLEVHGGRHEELFMLPETVALQKRFLDFYLKGIDNGWEDQPPVLLNVRHPGEVFVKRNENEWPLARTKWTPLFLNSEDKSASWQAPMTESRLDFDAMGEGATFFTKPFETETELTGPVAAKLFVASSTSDADLFVTLQVFDASDQEIWFQGTLDPCTPVAQGCLRASHRRLDPARSSPYQPYHPHDQIEPLEPGVVYELDVEIWPTSIVLPAGYRLAVTVSGRDFARGASGPDDLANRGSGPFLHNDPEDRPAEVFGGTTTIFTGATRASYILLPVIPGS
jgi:predicted acyl esterase